MKKGIAILVVVFCLGIFACKETPTTPTTPKRPPTIISFYASPSTVERGESTTLVWSTSNASTVSIDQGIGSVAANGEKTIKPSASTTYTLTAGSQDGTVTATATVTVKEVAILVLDGAPRALMKNYGCPYFDGYVLNTGPVTGYNAMIEFRAYSDTNFKTIIDTASGFPADLGDIGPGQRAHFEAVFFNLSSWKPVKSWDYKITWLNRNVAPHLQRGIMVGGDVMHRD